MKNRTANSSRQPRRRLFVEALERRELLNATPADGLLFQFRPGATDQVAALLASAQAEHLSLTATGIDGLYRATGDGAALDRLQAEYQGNAALAYVEPNYVVGVALVPNDPLYTNGSLYGLSGTFGVKAPQAWDLTTGSTGVVVGDIDTGVDYTHPDLYRNMWINWAEVSPTIQANLQDFDGDGRITYYDLNDSRNQGAGKIVDGDANGRIDGRDLLRPLAQGGWADGLSNNGDNYVDDLIGWDFVNNDNDPMDDHGHGTHTSGTIAAMGNNALGVVGVNWRAQIMPLKFLSASGSGSTLGAVQAVRYAVDRGADLTSNSWGGGGYSQALFDAIAYADQANQVFVAAAGNNGGNNDAAPFYPSSYTNANVLSVAATDSAGNRASFSNYGATSVDLAAPGVDILSTLPGGGYASWSGTSMATPHVAGAAALLLTQQPSLTDSAVINRLVATVTPRSALAGRMVSGGILNAYEALRASSGPRVTASTPTGEVTGSVDRVRLTFDKEILVGSFAPADISLTGPGGAVLVSAVNRIDAVTYEVTFAPQSAAGTYNVTVGPDVRDLANHMMNQDGDATSGEPLEDRYTATFQITSPQPPAPAIQIIDDGDAGYSAAGAWDTYGGLGHAGDFSYSATGSGADVATWTFAVAPGQYKVAATWVARPNRATNAPYAVLDGAAQAGLFLADQRQEAADFSEGGTAWEDLGTVTIAGNSLVVKLSDAAGPEYVIADAVRIERVGDASPAPEVQVQDGSTDVADGTGSVSFGSVAVGSPVSKTFTVRNLGTATLTLGPSISAPAGFTVTAGFGSTTLAPGASTTFTVRLDAAAVGAYSGELSFANNDGNESPFNFTVSGSVTAASPAPEIQVVDGTTDIAAGSASVSFGGALLGSPVSKTFTVKNLGASNLTLGSAISVPAGFTVTTGFGSTTLAAGASTTFTVRLDAASPGSYTGGLSFTNNDGDESPFNFTVSGSVMPSPTAEIKVEDGSTDVADGTGSVNFGSTTAGSPVSKTFTVTNLGSTTLTLGPSITVPAGFTVTTGFGSTSLGLGASTTFTVRLDAAAAGNYSGELSFTNNDGDEGPFNFTIAGSVTTAAPPAVQVIDNGDAGFSTTGTWDNYTGTGNGGDFAYTLSGTGADVASWTFAVSAGQYRVSATWVGRSNRASDVPYTILDGTTAVSTVTVDQRQEPADFSEGGTAWEDLGTVTITGNTLVVKLSDAAGPEYVIADAIRIERIA